MVQIRSDPFCKAHPSFGNHSILGCCSNLLPEKQVRSIRFHSRSARVRAGYSVLLLKWTKTILGSGSHPVPVTVPRDEEANQRLKVFRETFEEIQEKVDSVEGELEELEDSGEADRQPVKHQQAVSKVNEINEQLQELREALEEVESGEDR